MCIKCGNDIFCYCGQNNANTTKKEMVLHAKTDTVGSECTVALGYTEVEWMALTEEEQQQVVNEYMQNVVETWVAAE